MWFGEHRDIRYLEFLILSVIIARWSLISLTLGQLSGDHSLEHLEDQIAAKPQRSVLELRRQRESRPPRVNTEGHSHAMHTHAVRIHAMHTHAVRMHAVRMHAMHM